jgi:catechol 2,3-dioxygenase-like lactoylglutathione lyase family enzyme
MTTTLNHVSIILEDLESARDFFVRNFGFSAGPVERLSGTWADKLNGMHGVVVDHIPLTCNGQLVELQKFVNPPSPAAGRTARPNRPGYRHIGLNIDDIDQAVTRLKAEGWRFLSDVQTVPEKKIKTVYFIGPEGILLHLSQAI